MIAPGGIPTYLTALDRWLLWRIEQRTNRKTGEITETKPPISYHTGKHCDVTDPRTWTSFANVRRALDHKTGAWDGCGFVLGDVAERGEFIIGADLDSCIDDEGRTWAMDFLTTMGSYAEISPGGYGIKTIARIRAADLALVRRILDLGDADFARTRTYGDRPPGRRHVPGVQLYLGKRFFTVTGNRWVP